MVVIEAYDLTKIYASRSGKHVVVALEGLNLTVPQGEVYGLLGSEGSGKTTLIKALFGMVTLDAGEVFINGLPHTNPRSRGNIGLLPEKPVFPGHLTAKQLLYLSGHLYEMKSPEIAKRAEMLLEQFDLHRWPDLKIKNFSRGLIKRVGIAQAMITDPDVLVLDEPFDGLDERHKVQLVQAVDKIRSEGRTVLISSHQRSDVEKLADRIGIIRKGKIVKIIEIAALREEKCMYEIEASIGHAMIEFGEDVGKKIRVSTDSMIVELTNAEMINEVIDAIRLKGVNIVSVKPMKTKLEQSLYKDIDKELEAEKSPRYGPSVTV